ncbi:UDP-N-acetylglucosamine 2-epimerase (hydrolyzing) [bacterium]|nr:UDP-N-acetylglucosamine 2-epimerase (hydrolyzing) [bacterium]
MGRHIRKIAIVTGSRGEYGYIRPVINRIRQDPNIDYFAIATNAHLLTEFGSSIKEFGKDRIKVKEKIYNTLDGYNLVTMAKSLGIFLTQLPEVLDRTKPDIILISGDRGEQLMAAIAGAYMQIPVAHIQSGEISGHIDGITRHAITKFAHIHFCANKEFAERVRKMGEQNFRIFITGAPQLDELFKGKFTEKKQILRKYNLKEDRRIFLLIYHPVAEEYGKELDEVRVILESIKKFDAQIISIFPNSDMGSKQIKEAIERWSNRNFRIFRNLPRQDYLGILKISDIIVGNSSSAIIEAPVFKIPAINIGPRQSGRLQANNVINVDYNKENIIKAIKKAMSSSFRENVKKCVSVYGNGNSSSKIVEILKNIKIDDKLLNKRLTY